VNNTDLMFYGAIHFK